jgi:hypothetical protein
MPAFPTDALPSNAPRPFPRVSELPSCPICADSMIAAEASAFTGEGGVSYLWSCETCGYGFVTNHKTRFVCS